VDISIPILETLAIPGISRALAAAGDYVYAGDSAAILDVIALAP